MSYRDEYLNKEFEALERRVERIYGDASKAVLKRLKRYLKKYPNVVKTLEKQARDGRISDAEYKQQLRRLVFGGRDWLEERYRMAEILYEADEEVFDYINDRAPEVYEVSRNIGHYEVEKHYDRDLDFSLFVATMSQLQKLPKKKVNKTKDIVWNERRIQTAVTKYAKRYDTLWAIGKRAVRYVTSTNKRMNGSMAQYCLWGISDQGEWESMLDAKAKGINVVKRWLATLDNHTRDTHRDLDGQEQDVEDYFEVDGYKIMFPRDPSAEMEMIINCRCELEWVYPDYEDLHSNFERVENIKVGGSRPHIDKMSYRDWERWKKGL